MLLPWVLRYIGAIAYPYTKIELEISTIRRYTDCLVGMGLLLSVVASGIFSDFKKFVDFETSLEILATLVPENSTFYINYIVYACFFGLGTEISQVIVLAFELVGISGHYEMYYFYYYPMILFMFSICLTYAVIAPFIVIWGACYFLCAYFIFTYQLLFVYKPRACGGRLFPIVYSRLHVGLYIADVVLIGMSVLKDGY
eukprot:UN32691